MLAKRKIWPRPLVFHLSTAQAVQTHSLLSYFAWQMGSMAWPAGLQESAAALKTDLEALPAGEVAQALLAETLSRLQACMVGVAAYQNHPFHRALPPAPVLFERGTMQVLDFQGTGTSHRPFFLVPSLVNRAHILDLYQGQSMVRWLRDQGHGALLVDWQEPGPEERQFSVGDYISQRLEPAFDAAIATYGGPMPIVGYCMGGTMALPLALRRQDHVSGFAALATPWDFTHFNQYTTLPNGIPLQNLLEPILQAHGELPIDVMQVMFAGLDLSLTGRKFRRFAELDSDSDEAVNFVAMEDWANDGVPLAAPAARECFDVWFQQNQPVSGTWHVAGTPVQPAELQRPSLVVMPQYDRIVPPQSSGPLAEQLSNAETLKPNSGHVAMVAGLQAESLLWEPLCRWLSRHVSQC